MVAYQADRELTEEKNHEATHLRTTGIVQACTTGIRAAETESESESESVGVGCFSRSRSRSRSRQNLPTPTDSEQALIPDSQQSPCRLFWHFSAHNFAVD